MSGMGRALASLVTWTVACGGAAHLPAQPEAQPLPVRAPLDAGAAQPEASACLAPWGKAVGDARVDPKPIDLGKLAEVDRIADPAKREYVRARTYFEAQRWVEAARGFRAFAFERSDQDDGIYAVQLYLESLDVLAARAGRPQCYEDMIRDVPPLHDLYCAARRASHEDECVLLERVQSDVLRLQAQSTVDAAEQRGDKAGMHDGAEKYLALVRAECLGGGPSRGGGARCDELAYDAAVAFIASGDTDSAEHVKGLMLDPKNGMDKSPLVAKLVCRLGGPCP